MIKNAKLAKSARFSDSQIEALRQEYAKLETIPTSALPRFHAMWAKMNDATILQVAGAGIRFMSALARNEVTRRGIAPDGAVR